MAEASPRSIPRAASISAVKAFSGIFLILAISRNAFQNSGSKLMLVRCPFSVTECFTGRVLMVRACGRPRDPFLGQVSASGALFLLLIVRILLYWRLPCPYALVSRELFVAC